MSGHNVAKWIHGSILAYQFVHLINACVIHTNSATGPGITPGKCSDFWTGERELPHLDFSVSVIVLQCSQSHCCLCSFGDRGVNYIFYLQSVLIIITVDIQDVVSIS